jgi:hypothetical protein
MVPVAWSQNIGIVTAEEYGVSSLFYCSEESELKNHSVELRVSVRQKLQLRTLILQTLIVNVISLLTQNSLDKQ